MPFGSTEFVGLQHSEFGPTIPTLQSIDSFDAVPPVLSEEWSRLGKELSQCTGAEVVPRDNIHTALLLYGVRHEGNAAVKQSPSGFMDDVNNNVKKLDSSLLLVGVRQSPRAGQSPRGPGLGDRDPNSPSGSNLSLSSLQKMLSPGGLRRDVLRRSASLPDLTAEPQLLRECSFSTSASDEVPGEARNHWNTDFFDTEGPEDLLDPATPVDGAPASALVAGLFEMSEEDAAPAQSTAAGAPVPKSPGLSFGLREMDMPQLDPAQSTGSRDQAKSSDAPPQGPPPAPAPAAAAPAAPPAPAASVATGAPKPAKPQKQAVQSLLQLLKPLQDHQKQLQQTKKGSGRPADAAPVAGAPSAPPTDGAIPASPATPPSALGIPVHSPIQQQATTTRRHHRHHMVHISSQDTAPQAYQSPGSQAHNYADPMQPGVVVLMPQIQAYAGGPAVPPQLGMALPGGPAQPFGDAAYAQQYMYAAGQPAMNACLVFPANATPVGLPRNMM